MKKRIDKVQAKALKAKNKSIDRARNFIGGVRIQEVINGMKVLSCCAYDDANPASDPDNTIFRAWCTANNIYYYGKPKEKFSVTEAVLRAKAIKAKAVILDNMS